MTPQESSVWTWMRRTGDGLSGLDQEKHDPSSRSGLPDSNHCYRGLDFWVEHKVGIEPTKPTSLVKLKHPVSDDQIRWHRKRMKAGGLVFILVRMGNGSKARHYLIEASHGPQLGTVPEATLAAWSVCDPASTWAETLEEIRRL